MAKAVLVLGGIGENPGERDIYGASHLAASQRIPGYLSLFDMKMPPLLQNLDKRKKLMESEQVKKMPPYPQHGFIEIIDDTLVIKFSGPQQ